MVNEEHPQLSAWFSISNISTAACKKASEKKSLKRKKKRQVKVPCLWLTIQL
jgi:hypothetical protein